MKMNILSKQKEKKEEKRQNNHTIYGLLKISNSVFHSLISIIQFIDLFIVVIDGFLLIIDFFYIFPLVFFM